MPRKFLLLTCSDCSSSYKKQSSKPAKDGKHRCDKCRRKLHRVNFEKRHGKTAWFKYAKDNPKYKNRIRERSLKTNYGIDNVIYEKMFELQGRVCAICKEPCSKGNNLAVDHCHLTGQVRGLLCHRCNMSLGTFKDNLSLFRSASSYLLRFDKSRSWDWYFLDIAELVATRSKDKSSQVGAVIVKDRSILTTGYNGFPRGCNDQIQERHDRPMKYIWTIHSEENAIFNAARMGSSVEGATIYVTHGPCSECAKAIVQSGIVEVVYNPLNVTYGLTESIEKAKLIFQASRIIFRPPE